MAFRWVSSARGALGALILPLLLVGVAFAQAGPAPAGDVIAGDVSPWKSAHFVLYAYGAILVGIVAYVWRLAGMASRLRREAGELSEILEKQQGS